METHEIEALEIELLLDALLRRSGYDFRSYARASIERRTRQFLSGNGFDTVSELLGRALRDEALLSRLIQSYSLTVTEMFRDPQVFLAIREQVVPLLRTWPHVKVWCAGCATGEEAYSLAILLREEGLLGRTVLYATDFNDGSLETARGGVYPTDRIREATRNHQRSGGRESFGGYYRARYGAAVMDPALKARITFANHNLVSDGVFGEMHLIFCRNVLIYFDRALQGRVLDLFADSLARGGFLCLGLAEDTQFTGAAHRFEVVDCEARIYRRLTENPTSIEGEEGGIHD
ncbi:MAG: protein-glutamate O-methyltransferase CheR [Pseudomonadota bacterium]